MADKLDLRWGVHEKPPTSGLSSNGRARASASPTTAPSSSDREGTRGDGPSGEPAAGQPARPGDREALDAYSSVITAVALDLAPSVANLRVYRRRAPCRRGRMWWDMALSWRHHLGVFASWRMCCVWRCIGAITPACLAPWRILLRMIGAIIAAMLADVAPVL